MAVVRYDTAITMDDSIQLFDYRLPEDRIAQSPAQPRESAKLMVLSRKPKQRTHDRVSSLPKYLKAGDVIVVNNTRVFKARLITSLPSGARIEIFLVRALPVGWLALGKPGKKLVPGMTIPIGPGFTAKIVQKNEDGTIIVDFSMPPRAVIDFTDAFGSVPVPPYIKNAPDLSAYQTVYAKHEGSVAAPTAGFHLTAGILETLKKVGVEVVEITLHVGLGTFLPIKTQSLSTHAMHSEWAEVSESASHAIMRAKKEGRRIIAVGTTTVRTLEGVASLNNGVLRPYSGDISLFIKPGFTFRIIDGLLTNFHLPKSTLLVLVSAFAGRSFILESYTDAVNSSYRFYSFGDAMLIV